MKELIPGLYVGGITDYNAFRGGSVVSATKTVHRELIGNTGRGDPSYIVAERPRHLILNWVDGPAHLYDWSGPRTFSRALDFIQHAPGDVLVHCDAGISRSLTLCLLYLAKREKLIPGESFYEARRVFQRLYPLYSPGGIAEYVSRYWDEIK